MAKQHKLKIKQEHIDCAGQGTDNCPIALALKDHFNAHEAFVGARLARVIFPPDSHTTQRHFVLDHDARKFLIQFDDQHVYKPKPEPCVVTIQERERAHV